MTTISEIQDKMAAAGIDFVLAQFVDIHGAAKVKMCPASYLQTLVDEGAGFAGAAVWGMGQGPHSHDMLARIDLESYTPIPWQTNTARFASDLYVDGNAHGCCPRVNLKRVLGILKSRHGLVANIGIEPEHFLVVRTPEGGIAVWDPQGIDQLSKPCYDYKGIAPAMDYLQDITTYCNGLGWGVYQADHEDGNGQYEINFNYADALTTSDRLTFFKMMTNQVAQKYGAIATHMAKPFSDRTGSGAHIHYHLADATTGENVFTDEADPAGFGLSKIAYHFLAGVLKHAPALCAIGSPTPNCYRRLQIGPGLTSSRSGFTWTPAFISYGDNNRTQMLRICGPGHVEDRSISAAVNPYLILAAYIAAGLDGIAKELPIPNPNLGNLYTMARSEIYKRGLTTLPQSLRDALIELEQDPVILDALGPISGEFMKVKWREWNEYHRQVSRWETDQYLTLF
ncbi:MAG: type III glutamate--ammonia ligase [Verrucomicrobia bacterium]|nr:MAG: type III glutamate--ammonia ligase [Verrucomicrobiota bacterium]